jgi:hypothetical protein
VPETEARVMAATQKPLNGSAFGASMEQAARKIVEGRFDRVCSFYSSYSSRE